jgi:hypothetical protein
MGTVNVYCFIEAKSREGAVRLVNFRLGDRLGREFYDGFEVQESEIRLLSDIAADYLTEAYTRSQNSLQQLREEAEKARKAGDRGGEAIALRYASDLLFENMCPAMPWHNIGGGDFSLPSDRRGWWAVMVSFYY